MFFDKWVTLKGNRDNVIISSTQTGFFSRCYVYESNAVTETLIEDGNITKRFVLTIRVKCFLKLYASKQLVILFH